jgi:hypothetical protein
MKGSNVDVCDVCDKLLEEQEGYLLTPREVLTTPGYWQKIFCDHDSIQRAFGKANVLSKAELASRLAGQSAPWMVCDDCINIFSVDRDQAKTHALKWYASDRMYAPPGSGPVPLSEVNMGDSSAYLKAEAAGRRAGRKLPIDLSGLHIPTWWVVLVFVAVVGALIGGIYYTTDVDEEATDKARVSLESE